MLRPSASASSAAFSARATRPHAAWADGSALTSNRINLMPSIDPPHDMPALPTAAADAWMVSASESKPVMVMSQSAPAAVSWPIRVADWKTSSPTQIWAADCSAHPRLASVEALQTSLIKCSSTPAVSHVGELGSGSRAPAAVESARDHRPPVRTPLVRLGLTWTHCSRGIGVGAGVGAGVGEPVGSELVGIGDGAAVGSELVGKAVGKVVGAVLIGDAVGIALVGDVVGELVGSEVVGLADGELVGDDVGTGVDGDMVGARQLIRVPLALLKTKKLMAVTLTRHSASERATRWLLSSQNSECVSLFWVPAGRSLRLKISAMAEHPPLATLSVSVPSPRWMNRWSSNTTAAPDGVASKHSGRISLIVRE